MSEINTVSIKFNAKAYNVFRSLQNKYWFAIGEYVDNSVQSYQDNEKAIREYEGDTYKFEINIDFDWEQDTLTISDNAGGINATSFSRAFEPANIPLDNSGLHEFGMGMKTASIWLADVWTVRTSAVNEEVERYVEFDLKKVLASEKEELTVVTVAKPKEVHYTTIILHRLSKNSPSAFQLPKLKSHLASIYRKFIRDKKLCLRINGEQLNYNDPEVLNAPYYLDKEGSNIYWRKEINYDDGTYKATGFLALLNEMSTSIHNGLALFRRGRVIEGSHDEKYIPKVLFGQVGSARYKRLFGELELEGFEVSFNKGSFQELGDIEALMLALKIELSSAEQNLLKQGDEYRKPKLREEAVNVAKELISSLEKEDKNTSLDQKVDQSIKEMDSPLVIHDNILNQITPLETHEKPLNIKGQQYLLKLEIINESKVTDLYNLAVEEGINGVRLATYRVNLNHPFFERFEIFKDEDDYKPILTIIRALVIAELHAPSQGTKNAGNIRLNFNIFLRHI